MKALENEFLMRDRGVTDRDPEERLGIGKGMVSHWKYGDRNTYLYYINAICDFLGTNPNYLFRCVTEDSNELNPVEEDVLRMLRMVDELRQKHIRHELRFLRKKDYKSTLSKKSFLYA